MSVSYLTVVHVAELLKVSEKTVRRMVRRREIPAFKVGNQWRFIEKQIAAWAEDRVAAVGQGS